MSPTGFEPVTASLEGRCSIQLSYEPVAIKKVGVAGFEPAASTSQTWRDNRATLHPVTYLLYCTMSMKPKIKFSVILAERQGFEPWVPLLGYDDLANRSFRPLRHLSFAIKIIKIASANVIFKKHSCKLKTTFFK